MLNTATTMTGSGKSIKERIALIVKKPKMALYTMITVVIIAAVAVGCTFTGAEKSDTLELGTNSYHRGYHIIGNLMEWRWWQHHTL